MEEMGYGSLAKPASARRLKADSSGDVSLLQRLTQSGRMKKSRRSPHNPVFTLTQLRTRSLLRIVLLLPPKEVPLDVPLYVPGVGASLSPNVE